MTDEELIERLRDWPYQGETMANAAADRIEALTSERDRWKDACRSASRDLNIVVPDNDRLKSERDAAEAKLAKAVEALEFLEIAATGSGVPHPKERELLHDCIRKARATIAEIKGESHD